jgi:murein DD-endopeptidase MepM/ murein hydrolase activator NlpD
MRHDYKYLSNQEAKTPSKFRPEKTHVLLVSAIAAGLVLGFSLLPNQAGANKNNIITASTKKIEQTVPQVKSQRIIESLPLPEEPHINSLLLPLNEPVSAEQEKSLSWKTVKIKSGDTMAGIFSKLGISATVLHQIVNLDKNTRRLANIRPGNSIRFQFDEQGTLHQLLYKYDIANSLQIKKAGTGYSADILTKSLETRIAHTSAEITHSLFVAGQSAGLSDNMTMKLANIFGWDVDFALDIRKGDHFTVIYEEIFLDDKKIKEGNILAAEFHNRGKTYRAIRYQDKTGHAQYYSPKGMSMRKAFLRSPVEFSRISSRFSLGRKHPILNKIRAHKGVDYAARRGTPIKATGDGKIVFKGNKGGYGKTIIIKHGSAYSTLYAHMRSYNKKSRIGSRVKQGQVIGYIGSSGLATGPHLHFEFRVNGVHRNPLTVRLPKASPLPSKYRDDFNSKAENLVAQLNLIKTNILASLQ